MSTTFATRTSICGDLPILENRIVTLTPADVSLLLGLSIILL